jgi:opacity protein-like surface antigen
MKRILIAATLTGMLMPAVASAELDYNIVDAGITSKINRGTQGNFSEFILGASKSVFQNLFLVASYQTGTLPTTTSSNNTRVHSTYLGAGFHTAIKDYGDAVVAGRFFQGTDLIPGSSESANGYDISAGVRSQFSHGLEGSVMAVYSSISKDSYSNNDTYAYAQFGFDFTESIQLYGGIDFWRSDQTMNFGLRVFY